MNEVDWKWPEKPEICWYKRKDILEEIRTPSRPLSMQEH